MSKGLDAIQTYVQKCEVYLRDISLNFKNKDLQNSSFLEEVTKAEAGLKELEILSQSLVLQDYRLPASISSVTSITVEQIKKLISDIAFAKNNVFIPDALDNCQKLHANLNGIKEVDDDVADADVDDVEEEDDNEDDNDTPAAQTPVAILASPLATNPLPASPVSPLLASPASTPLLAVAASTSVPEPKKSSPFSFSNLIPKRQPAETPKQLMQRWLEKVNRLDEKKTNVFSDKDSADFSNTSYVLLDEMQSDLKQLRELKKASHNKISNEEQQNQCQDDIYHIVILALEKKSEELKARLTSSTASVSDLKELQREYKEYGNRLRNVRGELTRFFPLSEVQLEAFNTLDSNLKENIAALNQKIKELNPPREPIIPSLFSREAKQPEDEDEKVARFRLPSFPTFGNQESQIPEEIVRARQNSADKLFRRKADIMQLFQSNGNTSENVANLQKLKKDYETDLGSLRRALENKNLTEEQKGTLANLKTQHLQDITQLTLAGLEGKLGELQSEFNWLPPAPEAAADPAAAPAPAPPPVSLPPISELKKLQHALQDYEKELQGELKKLRGLGISNFEGQQQKAFGDIQPKLTKMQKGVEQAINAQEPAFIKQRQKSIQNSIQYLTNNSCSYGKWMSPPSLLLKQYEFRQKQLGFLADIQGRVQYHVELLAEPSLSLETRQYHLSQLDLLKDHLADLVSKLPINNEEKASEIQAEQTSFIKTLDQTVIQPVPVVLPKPTPGQVKNAQEWLKQNLRILRAEVNQERVGLDLLDEKFKQYQQMLTQQENFKDCLDGEQRTCLEQFDAVFKLEKETLEKRLTQQPANQQPENPVQPPQPVAPVDQVRLANGRPAAVVGRPPIIYQAAPAKVNVRREASFDRVIAEKFKRGDTPFVSQEINSRSPQEYTQLKDPVNAGVQVDIGSDWARVIVPQGLRNDVGLRKELNETTLETMIELSGRDIIITLKPHSVESYMVQANFLQAQQPPIDFDVDNHASAAIKAAHAQFRQDNPAPVQPQPAAAVQAVPGAGEPEQQNGRPLVGAN